MPVFTVTSPDGRRLRLEGDGEPTEQELDNIFAEMGAAPEAPADTTPLSPSLTPSFSFAPTLQAPRTGPVNLVENFPEVQDREQAKADVFETAKRIGTLEAAGLDAAGGDPMMRSRVMELGEAQRRGLAGEAKELGVAYDPITIEGESKPLTDLRSRMLTSEEWQAFGVPPLAADLIAGKDKAGATLIDMLSTPENIAQLAVMAGGPKILGNALGKFFQATMASQIPPQASAGLEALKAGRYEEAAENLTLTLGTAAMLGAPAVFSRRGATRGTDNARSLQEAAEIHGALREQSLQGQREVPPDIGSQRVQLRPEAASQEGQARLLLTPDELSDVVPVLEESTGPIVRTAPLQRGAISSIDRATGEIILSESEFGPWLRSVPKGQRPQAVRSLLSEEAIHLATSDADATAYWNSLTRVEQSLARRIYTGKWGQTPGITPERMAQDALRFRLQQAARMTPREFAEAATRDRLGLQTLDAIGRAIQSARETLGTKASKEGLAVLKRMEENLKAARAAVSPPTEGADPESEPFAMFKQPQEKKRVIVEGPGGVRYPATFDGIQDFSMIGRGKVRQITTLEEIPGVSPKHGTTYDFDLEKKGFKVLDEEAQPLALRKGLREAPEPDRSFAEQLTSHYVSRYGKGAAEIRAMGYVPDFKTALESFAQTPDEQWKISGKLRQKVNDYFRAAEGTPHSRAQIVSDSLAFAGGFKKEAQNLLSLAVRDLEALKKFSGEEKWSSPDDRSRFGKGFLQIANERVQRAEQDYNSALEWIASNKALLKKLTGSEEPLPFSEEIPAEFARESGEATAPRSGLKDALLDQFESEGKPPTEPPRDQGLRVFLWKQAMGDMPLPPLRDPNQLDLPFAYRKESDRGIALTPLAFRKRKETSEQDIMFLPPAPRGTARPGAVESGAEVVTPAKISEAANENLSSDRPSFKGFSEAASARFGGIQPEQLRDAWEDSVWKTIRGASGAKLEQLRETLKLVRNFGSRTIANAAEVPKEPKLPSQRTAPAMREFREARRRILAEQKYRNHVATEIGAKLVTQSYDAASLKKALERQVLDVDDLADNKPGFYRELSADEVASLPVLKQLVTQDFRAPHEGGTRPESNTRRVVALLNKNSGQISLVSIYEHGRGGVLVVNPAAPRGLRPTTRFDANLLKNWRPIATGLLREPVKNFHQKFSDLSQYNERFGNDAKAAVEAQAAYESTLEPGAGILDAEIESRPTALEPGQRLTDADAGAIIDHLHDTESLKEGTADEVRSAVEYLSSLEKKGIRYWRVATAYQKVFESVRSSNPELTPEQALQKTYEQIALKAKAAPDRAAFQRDALNTFGGQESAGDVRAGPAPAAAPSQTGRELRALDRPPIPVRPAPAASTGKVPFPFEPGGPRELGTLARGRGELPRLKQVATEQPTPRTRTKMLPEGQGVVRVTQPKPEPKAGPLALRPPQVPPASEGTMGPLAFNKRTRELGKFTGRIVKDPVQAFSRWYGAWLSDTIRSNGREEAARASDTFDAITDRAKAVYGKQTPVLNRAKEMSGGSARLPVIGEVPNPKRIIENTWLQRLSHPYNKDFGIANIQEAVEGRLLVPPKLQPTIDAIGKANLQAGMVVAPVTPGFKPSNKWQRNMTALGFDVLSEGPSHPIWNGWTRQTALLNKGFLKTAKGLPPIRTNGDAIRFTRKFFKEWGDALKDPASDANRVERINQDFNRLFPRAITHARVQPFGYQELIHTNPVNYLEMVAQRAAFTRAFREQFPNNDVGRADFAALDAAVRSELPPNIVPYWDALVKTAQARPSDSYLSLGPLRPGTPIGEGVKAINQTVMGTLKRLALSAQVVIGLPETFGTGVAELGVKNKLRAAGRLKQLWNEMEKTGQVNAMIYDWSIDPSSPIRSSFRLFNNVLAKGFAENLNNELQGRWNAAMAIAAADRIRNQRTEPLTKWEKRQYPETFRKMQFTKDQVDAMMLGNGALLAAFERRFPSWMSGENAPMTERSMASQKRWLNSVFAFQQYPMTVFNQFTKNLSRLGEAYRSGDSAQAKAATEGMARFLFGKGAQGVGYIALGSLLSGGLPGLRVKAEEAKDEPMQFMLEALLSSLSGPYYLLWQAMRNKGLLGAGETLTRTMFPVSQFNDLQDMMTSRGQYRDQDVGARIGRYLMQKTPGLRAVKQGLAAFNLSNMDAELQAAIKGMYRWKRDELGWDERTSSRKEDERRAFRTEMRAAVAALQENDLDTYLERLEGALFEASELPGKEKPQERAASSLRGRKLLLNLEGGPLTLDELDALSARIGERAVDRLLEYDATLEALAKALN